MGGSSDAPRTLFELGFLIWHWYQVGPMHLGHYECIYIASTKVWVGKVCVAMSS